MSHNAVGFFRAGSEATRESSRESPAERFGLTEITLLPDRAVSRREDPGV